MNWVIQSKGDRNKWKKERNFKSDWLVVYGNQNWNGISAFHLYHTLLLSLKKIIYLTQKPCNYLQA